MRDAVNTTSLPPDPESQILEVERRWAQAHLDLDLGAIDDILAENYRKIAPDGRVIDKRQALAFYAARETAWEVAESDQLEVYLHGTAALVIGRWTGRGYNMDERYDYRARFASVYILVGGQWKLAFDQATPIDEDLA